MVVGYPKTGKDVQEGCNFQGGDQIGEARLPNSSQSQIKKHECHVCLILRRKAHADSRQSLKPTRVHPMYSLQRPQCRLKG